MIDTYKLYYGLFLLAFWLLSCTGFVAEEILPPLEKVRPYIQTIADIIIIGLGILTIRQRGDILVIVSFLVLAFLSTLVFGGEGMFEILNGMRDFAGLLFVYPLLRWFFNCSRGGEFVKSMDWQLKLFLWLQAATITFQFIKYGANDHGGGTMGLGASGQVSMSIYLISFFLTSRNWDCDNYFRSLWRNRVNIFLLYPTFLNETKVSLILLILYFVLLMKYDKKFALKLIYIIPLFIALLVGMFNIYLSITGFEADKILTEEYATQYLYGDDLENQIEVAMMIQDGTMEIDPRDAWTVDIPRLGKLFLIIPELRDTRGGLTFGAGLGQFKGSRLSTPPRFARINSWLLNGSRPWTFFLLVQVGFLGLLWFIVVIVRDLNNRDSLFPLHRRVTLIIAASIFLIMFYNDSLRFFNFCTIIFYIALYMKYYGRETEEEKPATQIEEHISSKDISIVK